METAEKRDNETRKIWLQLWNYSKSPQWDAIDGLSTDRLSRLRFVQTVKPCHPTLGIKQENILIPLNEMQFTDCQRTDHRYYSLSDRKNTNTNTN